MNIVIFGPNSELGKKIILDLLENNKIIVISRKKPKVKNKCIKFIYMKNMNKFFFRKYLKSLNFFKNKKIDIVIYLPAIRDIKEITSKKLDKIDELYNINSLNFIKFVEFNNIKLLFKKTHLIYVSSISVIMHLKKNIFYGSSKLQSEFYLKSLAKKFRNLNIVIYRLGYLDTKNNSNRNFFFKKCKLSKVSNYIISGFNKHKGVKYFPRFWLLIKIMVNLLPDKIAQMLYNK